MYLPLERCQQQSTFGAEMDLIDRLRDLAAKAEKKLQYITNEEATKTSLVLPFIQALGYDVYDPKEVAPEFTADIGIKKGEKVDYAILKDSKPIMLFECKCSDVNLENEPATQLRRYFDNVEARIAVLTNGLEYRFFADIEKTNIMDEKPFFVFDIRDISDENVNIIKMKFTKDNFKVDELIPKASELKYSREIKQFLNKQLKEPDEDFIRYFGKQVYDGTMTKKKLVVFSNVIISALRDFINERVNERLESARILEEKAEEEQEEAVEVEDEDDGIITTEEEMEAFYIVRALLSPIIEPERVTLKDTRSYCGILFDNNTRKPICRLYFDAAQKSIQIRDESKKWTKIEISRPAEIYKHASKLINVVKGYLVNTKGE
jgi:hypothetical protein